MNYNAALTLMYAVFSAAGTALVITEHYARAWIPFLAMFCVGANE